MSLGLNEPIKMTWVFFYLEIKAYLTALSIDADTKKRPHTLSALRIKRISSAVNSKD
jgi:hypothetical protein